MDYATAIIESAERLGFEHYVDDRDAVRWIVVIDPRTGDEGAHRLGGEAESRHDRREEAGVERTSGRWGGPDVNSGIVWLEWGTNLRLPI